MSIVQILERDTHTETRYRERQKGTEIQRYIDRDRQRQKKRNKQHNTNRGVIDYSSERQNLSTFLTLDPVY